MADSLDVLVLGSGIIGCAIGYELARRGATVIVADDRAPGAGATQASAGMLAPYNEVEEEGPHLDLTVAALGRFDAFMARVRDDSGHRVEYQRSGTLSVAMSDAGFARLAAIAARLSQRCISAQLLDAAAVAREEPGSTHAVVGGLVVPAHGYVVAGALTQAMVAGAQRFGARFIEWPRAQRLRRTGTEIVVDNGRDSMRARHVVVAAGSWAGQIEIEGTAHRLPVHPVHGRILQLKWNGTRVRRVTWTDRCYLVPWADGSLLVGATVEDAGFDERTTVAGVRDLLDAVCDILPQAWTATLVATRAGLRPASPDGLPIIGASTVLPGVIHAAGHYRNGVLLAPLTAELVADLILEGRADELLDATNPARFGAL